MQKKPLIILTTTLLLAAALAAYFLHTAAPKGNIDAALKQAFSTLALFGKNGQPNAEAVRMVETQIMQGMIDSMQTRPPNERATMADYFNAMRDRRVQRGLPVLF